MIVQRHSDHTKGAGPGSAGFRLKLPDVTYSYRIDATGLYSVHRDGDEMVTVMFRDACPHQSLAMQGLIDALNAAVAE